MTEQASLQDKSQKFKVKRPTQAEIHEQKEKLVDRFFDMDLEQIKKRFAVLQELLDVIRGVKDVRGKLSPIMEPTGDMILTTARLTPIQSQAIADMQILPELYRFFEPLKSVAKPRCLTSISIGGAGREDAIRLTGAYGGSELLKSLGITLAPAQTDLSRKREEKRGIFKR